MHCAVCGSNQVALVLSHSNGVASLPRRYLDFVDLLDLPFDMPALQLAMAWHPRAQEDAGAVWLRECFVRTNNRW
jgi:DNA-binding transcriptional LysR family regulator